MTTPEARLPGSTGRRGVWALCILAGVLLLGIVLGLTWRPRSERSQTSRGVEGRRIAVPADAEGAPFSRASRQPEDEPPVPLRVIPRTIIKGLVKLNGKPVGGAKVSCESFYAASPPQVAMSEGDGRFVLDVSAQPSYRLIATWGHAYAAATVNDAQVAAAPITLELQALFYERVAFVTSQGEPVAVAGREQCALFPRSPLFPSLYNLPAGEVSWLPSEIDVGGLRENELAYMTTTVRGPGTGGRRIDFRGYEPVDVPMQLLPLERWPEAREVVLTPDPEEAPVVVHRVMFPDVLPPEQWHEHSGRLLELILSVTTTGEDSSTCWVTQKHPVFRLPRGTDIALSRLGERGHLRFGLRDEGDEIRVLVEWPRYAFLDLRYPASHPDAPTATSAVSVWARTTYTISGRLVESGHARFAYLPEGSYDVEISWWKGEEAAPFSTWRMRAPINLAMGPNTFEVTADEFLADTGR